ncbi:U3 snoRNP protein [Podochytrium sp. JEL0797]|nr:U3 snoRNP protein [Podochytrium sp. JEL0797]
MAESVRFHLEKMIPELEDLEQRGVFNKAEIKEIVKRRTAHEYAIHRRIGRRADYLKYIEYEINLDRLRKKRKVRLGLDAAHDDGDDSDTEEAKKKLRFTLSDYSLTKRINGLYQKALRKFGGDIDLWVQYFAWAQGMGASVALGRNFARAIQLHPTNPSMYILAAQYEFLNNKNMTSARVLMQRGLRMNKESTNLWHEYFKLELLWVEKIKERRRILFGDAALGLTPMAVEDAEAVAAPKRRLDENDDEEEEGGDTGVHLEQDASNGVKATLDIDPTIQVSNEEAAQDPALTMGKKLSSVQQAMIELAIPKAIYKNAITEIPTDLEFRIGFLKLYQAFGSDTKYAQEEVYDSLTADFGWDPLAAGVLAEKALVGVDVKDSQFPAALKAVVEAYEASVKKTPTPQMWTRYTTFLTETLAKVAEPNLQKYLFAILQKAYTRAHEAARSAPEMYLSWSKLNERTVKTSVSVLQKGIERYPASGVLWTAKLGLMVAEREPLGMSEQAVEIEFAKALGVVGKPVDGGMASLELKTERYAVWKLYLEWVSVSTDSESKAERLEVVEKRFREALGVQEFGGASIDMLEFESYITTLYLDWSFKIGGIERVRSASDRLMSFKQRSTFFFNACLEFEERNVMGSKRVEGGLVEFSKTALGQVATAAQVTRLRKMHELVCFSDTSRIDSWMSFLAFEMYVTKDFKRVNEVHWRANKEVADKDEFALRYDALRTE